MAISITCSHCQATLTFADSQAGQRVACLHCGAFLSVPGGHFLAGEPTKPESLPTPPELPPLQYSVREIPAHYDEPRDYEQDDYGTDDYEEQQRRRFAGVALGPTGNLSGWNLTRIGLGMMYWGMVAAFIAVLAYLVVVVFLLLSLQGGGVGLMDGPGLMGIFVIVLAGAIFASFVVACVGQGMCCTAPPESRARGLIVGSIICLFLTIAGIAGLMVLSFAMVHELAMRQGAMNTTVTMLMGVLFVAGVGIASHVLFISFLRTVCRYFHNEALVHSAGNYLVLYFVMIVAQVGISCLQGATRGAAATVAGCASLLLFILSLVLLIWYLRLIATTRDTIADAMRRSGD